MNVMKNMIKLYKIHFTKEYGYRKMVRLKADEKELRVITQTKDIKVYRQSE